MSSLQAASLVPRGFVVGSAVDDQAGVVIRVRSGRDLAECPKCNSTSGRVHSQYSRGLADLPIAGRTVKLVVLARRFRCDVAQCVRQIFAERFGPDAIAPWARRTARLDQIVHCPRAGFGRPGPRSPTDCGCRSATTRCCASFDGAPHAASRRRPRRVALGAATIDPALLTAAERLRYESYRRREDANAVVLALSKGGLAIKEIVRRTGFSRGLVRNVLRGQRTDIFRTRQSSLDPHLPWLDEQWAAGVRNSAVLDVVKQYGEALAWKRRPRRSSPAR